MNEVTTQRAAIATWMRIMRVYTKISHQETDLLRKLGISTAHFDALVQTMHEEGLTQKELSQRLLVTKGNVCYLVDKLEADKLLVRHSEGKTNRLYLTAKGRALIEEILPVHDNMIEGVLATLSKDEQSVLRNLLRKLERELE